jgi:hypothetical protein
MGIALRWREEPFDCEFTGASGEGTLWVYSGGQLVWQEPVRTAAAAQVRAQEVKALLLSPRAKHA